MGPEKEERKPKVLLPFSLHLYQRFELRILFVEQQHCPKTRIKISCWFQGPETPVDTRWRKQESKQALWRSGRSASLWRSRSVDTLPQKESIGGTKALLALFESKATQQQGSNSSPPLTSTPAAVSKTGRERHLQDRRAHNSPLKEKPLQVSEF